MMTLWWMAVGVVSAQMAGGTLVVNVPNAPGEIMLDGFPTGQIAPATLENVAPGTHLVQLEYGCMLGEKQATVQANKTTRLTLPMQYKGGSGTIRLKGVPYNATVLLDDAPVRSWAEGVEAKCGSRRLAVEAAGFEEWHGDTIITSDKWVTVEVTMLESEIQEFVPAPRSMARPTDDFEDDFEDYDDFDELDEIDAAYVEEEKRALEERDEYDERDDLDELDEPEESSSSSRSRDRSREYQRRQAEQEKRNRAQEEARQEEEDRRAVEEAEKHREEELAHQHQEEARRADEEDERRSRYGDIDSLDDEEEMEDDSSRRRSSSEDEDPDEFGEEDGEDRGASSRDRRDEEVDDYDSDDFEEEDYDDLDERGGSERLREPRKSSSVGSRSLKFGGTGGLAAVAVGGGVFGLISTIQYQAGYQNWEVIIAATGFGSPKEIEYWTLYVQPYKTRMVIGYVVAGVGLAASGAWFFVAPDGTVQVGISRRF